MTTRIVIHAGFHKTGTTSAQSMLRENAPLLEPHVRVYLKEAFEALTERARAFSIDPKKKTLTAVSRAARAFFQTVAQDDPRPILMSSEDLSGHMPGRHGLDCYDSAGLVMKSLSDAAFRRFGRETDLTFYFSTRTRDAWLRSTWWQNLRSTRLTEDFQTYCSRFDAARSLDGILEEIAEDVTSARVTSFRLEEATTLPLGPLDPLLTLLELTDLDRSALTVLPPENVQPDIGIDAVFLALNQSALPEKDLQEAKRLIRRMARQQES
ncbi:MAG: hypothetical protein MRY75_09115 [Marivita sp.]|uniref:hypothetical protein n=1 Tax=Marivita sp. TaxID=2003365 RepID=UPI0025C28C4A|nr:hypothetical protein [Marivita sp.]MCI5110704.1 hypothetical protein [Marivita sp.]